MQKPRRSMLYMPATNARAVEKARSLPVDALALDLEDSVAPEKKNEARNAAAAAVATGGFGRREVVIRTNGPDTAWFDDDFAVAQKAAPDAILVPKVERTEDLSRIAAAFRRHATPERTRLWIMMETPLAVLNAHPLAEASRSIPDCRLETFVLGNNDIQKVTRSLDHPERIPLMFAIQSLIMAARAYGLSMLDGVYNNFKDLDGFRRECEQGRLLGMDGKTLIHPSQIEIANAAYGPQPAEVDRALRIIAAFETPEAKGKGAINFEGEMVELLHLEIARRTVEMASNIAQAAR